MTALYRSDYYCPNFLLEDDLIKSPLEAAAGDLLGPPGFDVEVDWEAIERYRLP